MLYCERPKGTPLREDPCLCPAPAAAETSPPARGTWLPAALGTGPDAGVQTPATLGEPVVLIPAYYILVQNTFSSSHIKELMQRKVCLLAS